MAGHPPSTHEPSTHLAVVAEHLLHVLLAHALRRAREVDARRAAGGQRAVPAVLPVLALAAALAAGGGLGLRAIGGLGVTIAILSSGGSAALLGRGRGRGAAAVGSSRELGGGLGRRLQAGGGIATPAASEAGTGTAAAQRERVQEGRRCRARRRHHKGRAQAAAAAAAGGGGGGVPRAPLGPRPPPREALPRPTSWLVPPSGATLNSQPRPANALHTQTARGTAGRPGQVQSGHLHNRCPRKQAQEAGPPHHVARGRPGALCSDWGARGTLQGPMRGRRDSRKRPGVEVARGRQALVWDRPCAIRADRCDSGGADAPMGSSGALLGVLWASALCTCMTTCASAAARRP